MSNRNREAMQEQDFDHLLTENIPGPPPEEIIAEVTPWKRAMNRVLMGIAFNSVTLNFFYLQYILPAIGTFACLLGFRTLRRENRWFKCCYAISAFQMASLLFRLIINTTIYQRVFYASAAGNVLSIGSFVFQLILFVCLWKGLTGVKEKAGLPPRSREAVSLIIWYLLVSLLALVSYSGLIIGLLMIAAYIFILRSLFRLSKELDEAGYLIQSAPVRLADWSLGLLLSVFLLAGGACGYLFFDSYPMEWTLAGAGEHDGLENIKAHLIELGFPADILNDLRTEDIAACDGALQVVTNVHEYPFNEGRIVQEYREGDPELQLEAGYYQTTVYDVRELTITGIAVELPGEREQWKIFHHFLWTVNPGFCGTESIQLWPAYHLDEGWANGGQLSGQLLYDKDGVTFTSSYHYLGSQTYTSQSIFWGPQTSTDIFASFSLPNDGARQRGYISYLTEEAADGYIIDSWCNYTHQQTWFQYPVWTATDRQMAGAPIRDGAFQTVQDALQFYMSEEGEILY